MTLDEKLEHFYTSVIDSATKQNIEIVEEYKKTLQKHFESRKEAAIRKADAAYRTASDNILRERNRRSSAASIDNRRKVLEKTAEYSTLIFADVKKKLEEYKNTPAYDELLCAHITGATTFAKGDQITIYIDPSDASKKAALEEKTGVLLTVSNREFLGGIRAVIPSRSILIDHSFLTKLEEAKSCFTL